MSNFADWSWKAKDPVKQLKKRKKKLKKKFRKARSGDGFYDSEAWMELRYRVLRKYGAICQCCGCRGTPKNPIHVDHIKPRSRWPELQLEFSNLQVLCRKCNLGKSYLDTTDWRLPEGAAEHMKAL